MWAEGYNTHHLIDGYSMKRNWGHIMPHLVYNQTNLDAIVNRVKWALIEDEMDGAMLSQDMQWMRMQPGGLKEMDGGGYNNEVVRPEELCVISS
jgi:hypothetical protein